MRGVLLVLLAFLPRVRQSSKRQASPQGLLLFMPRGYPTSTIEQRIHWLLANPALWEEWDMPPVDISQEIVKRMKEAGLLAKSTYWKDVSIRETISEARNLRSLLGGDD